MTGAQVDSAVQMIAEACQRTPGKEPHVLPMYGALPAVEQLAVRPTTTCGVNSCFICWCQQVFAPAGDGRRKIIVATNIAEASVTIPGELMEGLIRV
jgi:ATP-dependent RNA helicase DDX35